MNKTATIQLRNLTIGYKGKVRPKIVAENICSDIHKALERSEKLKSTGELS